MGAYVYLAVAILAEVTATISLKLSDGFANWGWSIVVVVGYAIAFGGLSMALKAGMAVGVAYAVWAAIGVALVAVAGAVFLNESLNLTMVGGMLLVIGGVVLIEVGGAQV